MGSNELCSFIEYTLKVKIFNKGDYDLNSGIEKKYFQDLVSSAVLIPIYKKENSYFTILTKRSSNLNSHPGQISFPGGRYEKKDISIEQTAIREADEEIGVKKSNIRLLGRLDHYQTRTGFDIVPIVCFLNSLPTLKKQISEVDEIFFVPLSFLLSSKNHQIHKKKWKGKDRFFYAITYKKYYIWGATAGIIVNFYEKLNGHRNVA